MGEVEAARSSPSKWGWSENLDAAVTVLRAAGRSPKEVHEQAEASGQKPTFEQMKAAHEQAQQDTLTQLTPILSPAQLKKFQVLMAERGPPGRPH